MSDIWMSNIDIGKFPDVGYHIRCPTSVFEIIYDIISDVRYLYLMEILGVHLCTPRSLMGVAAELAAK